MTINKEEVKKKMIERNKVLIIEKELTLDYMIRMKAKADKENQPAFDMEIEKLKKGIESDKNFLKEF